ncbi:MAG: DNA helicase [Alphaproteobacteria bacterium]|nr:MAG: DNA helicase [Alphaproteobacteria bacterium]
MNFEELGLSAPILDAIKDCGYDTPTPIQEKAIPHILMSRDVVGLAQTGTGKTAGFTLPMIEILAGGRAKARMPRSLILSPTRELAAQIAENFDTYGKNSKLTKALLVGGSSMAEQIKILDRGADVLIATPGRLIDLFERGKILLNDIKILVIDEADRMLDMGFIPDIEKICSHLPPIRQTLLFSATMAPEIKKLTEKFLSNPREVAVSPPASTAVTVQQFRVNVSPKGKNAILEKIIKQEKVKTAFIFCNRKRDVDALSKWLQGRGHDARPLHGDMAQVSRTKTLEEFKAGKIPLLVCSDVAARGIDVASVSHVFNYDVPGAPDDYVHRVGRTGRAGETGRAWMLVTKYDDKQLNAVIKRIGKEIEIVDMGGERSVSTSKGDTGSRERSKPQSNPKPSASKPPHSAQKTPNVPKKKSSHTHDNKNESADSAGFGDDVPAFFK